jgi:S-adenosylmethionine decarboxylase
VRPFLAYTAHASWRVAACLRADPARHGGRAAPGAAVSLGGFRMQHLVIDAFVDDATRLGEIEPIFDLLNDLPGQIQMTKITQPYVFRYSGVVPEDWGVTGMVIIAESHISIHTFPEHNRFHMDVFSCKPFDYERTLEIIEDRLGVTRRAADVIRRPVVGEQVAEAGELHWRLQQMPAQAVEKQDDARVRRLLGAL